MKYSILLLIGIGFISCQKIEDDVSLVQQYGEVCKFKTEILSPEGFEVNTLGSIEFNGSIQAFQFVNAQTGYAMASSNSGGYVEVFKTTDGGQTWTDLNVGINQSPRSMVFKDENFGIITVHDITGCPPPNCQHKCVILKTENGGIDWEEVEIENLQGMLYHPKFDSQGNLYASLYLDGHLTLVKSVDDGANWDTLFSSPDLDFSLVTFSFEMYQDKIFVSANDGRIIVVDTAGTYIKTMEIIGSWIWDLEIIDENNLVVVVSGAVVKSINGGATWDTIYNQSARMIAFDSFDKGLMLLEKSSCPTDVYQVNDLIASTDNGGVSWNEAAETTTNMRISYTNSQRMGSGIWYMIIGNKLIEIKEK